MFNEFNTAEDMIDDMIVRGELSPAAADMDPAEVIEAYNQASGLTPDDPDYLVDPELEATIVTTASGEEIAGWALRSNPAATVTTPNVSLARAVDQLSRQLGQVLIADR